MRCQGLGVFVLTMVLAGCGGDDDDDVSGSGADGSGADGSGADGSGADGGGGTNGGGKNGGGTGNTRPPPVDDPPPPPPRDDGCTAPPHRDFDPTVDFDWDAPTPDIVVTSSADSGAGSLREALSQVEQDQVIGFDESLAGETIELSEELVVTKSITLDASKAPGLTLDGQGKTRIMSFNKALNSVVVGLTFVNGAAGDAEGGGIKVNQADRGDVENPNPLGSIEVIGCRFERNVGKGAGALFIGWRIDAIVRDSVFIENESVSEDYGEPGKQAGAIATRQAASLFIERSSFKRNRGYKCGAVYNILEPVEVTDSVFVDNEGTNGAGAFFTDGGSGAGPRNDPDTGVDGKMILRRVRMVGNTGTGDGGAMLIWGYPRDVLIIENSVILDSETTGKKGGAGRLHGLAEIRIDSTIVANSHSTQQGGGLWIDGSGDVTIRNSTFSGNRVDDDAGAGFAYHGSGSLTVESSLFAYNEAGRAAGAFWNKPNTPGSVSNSIFAFNVAGQSIGERHMGPRLEDGGGNIDFAIDDPDRGRVYEGSTFADPVIGELTELNGTWLHPLQEGSPAVGAATGSAPDLDARGASRDAEPDVGPHELGGSCK